MTFTINVDENVLFEELNEYLHGLLGYKNEEQEPHPWHSLPRSTF